jgi:hypothetical protein
MVRSILVRVRGPGEARVLPMMVRVLVRGGALPMTVRVRVLVREMSYL